MNEIAEESLLEDIENTEDIAEEDIEDHLDPDEDNVDEDNDTDETEELEVDDEAEKEDEEDTVYLVDGEEVTLSELQAGYSRQSDYTRKTQQVAEDRKAVVEQQQQLQQAQANVDANSQMVAAFVHQFLHEPNPNDYSAGNPAEMAQFQKDQHNY